MGKAPGNKGGSGDRDSTMDDAHEDGTHSDAKNIPAAFGTIKQADREATGEDSTPSHQPEGGSISAALWTPESPEDLQTYTRASAKARAWLAPLLLSVVLVAYLDRSALSYTAPLLIRELGLSEAAYGTVAGSFYVTYALLQLPSLWMAQRVGTRCWLAFIVSFWGLTTVATAFASTALQLIAARLILGALEAGTFPVIFFILDRYSTPADLAHFWGAGVLVMINVSFIVGGPIIGLVLWGLAGVGGLEGWQWVFISMGLLGLLVGLAVAFLLPGDPSRTSILTEEERRVVVGMKQQICGVTKADLWTPLRSWTSLYFGLMSILVNGPTSVLLLFSPLIIQDIVALNSPDTDSSTISLVMALTTIPAVMAAVALYGVATFISYGPRTIALPVGATILLVSLVLFLAFPLVYSTGSGFASLGMLTALVATYASFSAPLESLPSVYLQAGGSASAFYALGNMMYNLSAIWTPVIFGYMIQDMSVATATAVVGLVHILPLLALYVGFFVMAGEPICVGCCGQSNGHRRPTSRETDASPP